MAHTLSCMPHIFIPALSREAKPIATSRSRIDADFLRLDNDILPDNAIELDITARIVGK